MSDQSKNKINGFCLVDDGMTVYTSIKLQPHIWKMYFPSKAELFE